MTAKKKVRTMCVEYRTYIQASTIQQPAPQVQTISIPINLIRYLPSASSSIDDLRLSRVKSCVIRYVDTC